MTVRLLIDAERFLSAWLRDQAEVTALVGDRVYTVMPAGKVWPLVRLTRIGGAPDAAAEEGSPWADSPVIQIEAYGANKVGAWELLRTVEAVIAERIAGAHETARVHGVTVYAARYVPDSTFTPAQPRALSTVALTISPTPNP